MNSKNEYNEFLHKSIFDMRKKKIQISFPLEKKKL